MLFVVQIMLKLDGVVVCQTEFVSFVCIEHVIIFCTINLVLCKTWNICIRLSSIH